MQFEVVAFLQVVAVNVTVDELASLAITQDPLSQQWYFAVRMDTIFPGDYHLPVIAKIGGNAKFGKVHSCHDCFLNNIQQNE